MKILLLISFIYCIGYAIYVKIKFNVSSISESYYHFERQREGMGILFWLWTIGTAFTLLPCWLEVSAEDYQKVAFLSTVALVGVGCAPDYEDQHSTYHPIFTCICGALAVVWCILSGTCHLLLLLPVTFLAMLCKADWQFSDEALSQVGALYWVELASFLCIYGSVAVKLFG